MTRFNKIQRPTILYSIIIVVLCWAFLEGWFPFLRRQWIFLSLGLVVSFFTAPMFYISKQIFVIIGYFIVLYFNAKFGDKYFSDTTIAISEVLALAFPSALLYYAYMNKSKKDMVVILSSYFFVLVVSTIASFLIDRFLIPGAIRHMTALRVLESKEAVFAYYRLGLSSYSFPHALPILVPPLVMGFKSKKLSRSFKFTCVALLLSTLILVWLSGNMTALLLTILFFLMSYFTTEGTIRSNIRKLTLIFVLFLPLLSPYVMRPILQHAMNITGEESSYYEKFEVFDSGMAGESTEGSDLDARQGLYSQSLSGFAENIVWGTNSMVGGHSTFLDRLGVLGLLGFVPFVWFIILQLKVGGEPIPKKYKIYYFEGCLAGLMMLTLKSSFYPVFTIVLFVILPLLTYLISINEKE